MFRFHKQMIKLFGLSKTEINGMLILLPLTFLLLLSPSIYREYFGINYNTYETDKRLLDSLTQAINLAVAREESLDLRPSPEYFHFDPNTVSVDELVSMGLDQRLSNRIINYRKAGGSFRIKSDLKRIYGFPDSIYQNLDTYIDLPEEIIRPSFRKKYVKADISKAESSPIEIEEVEPFVLVDIASADTAELKKIRGIGPTYAKRIVGYRSLLGGYSSVNQLKEVYGFSDSLYLALKPHFTLSDSVQVQQISINIASFKQLNKHPYISFEQTKDILNTKSKNGKFRKTEDLFKLNTFDSAQVYRLAPYLKYK